MALFYRGDMWTRYGQVDLFCITTNSTVKKDGSLVMGAGIARQARDRFPDLADYAGLLVGNALSSRSDYGFLVTADLHPAFGLFQVKRHFKDKADLGLIKLSTVKLFEYIVGYNLKSVCLNFPGIGNGQLNREDILPIISYLPDCVEIWELK